MSIAPERIQLAAIAPQAWKNGAGSTRELAVEPPGAANFDWRLSVAEVDRAAPFSVYPGIDRVIVLLDGAGLRLRGDVAYDLIEPGEPFGFAGEARIEAEPIGGATRDFNLMLRRGAWAGRVSAQRGAALLPAADAGLLFAVRGRWAAPVLGTGEALLWRTGRPALELEPGDGDALLITVELMRVR